MERFEHICMVQMLRSGVICVGFAALCKESVMGHLEDCCACVVQNHPRPQDPDVHNLDLDPEIAVTERQVRPTNRAAPRVQLEFLPRHDPSQQSSASAEEQGSKEAFVRIPSEWWTHPGAHSLSSHIDLYFHQKGWSTICFSTELTILGATSVRSPLKQVGVLSTRIRRLCTRW